MTDCMSKQQRSYVMSRIRGKNTSIELILRSALHVKGHRFRTHVRGLPGTPDIVFSSSKLVVFVDGDFWHGYMFPRWEMSLPKFWRKKIRTNRARDRRCHAKLRRAGWTVIRIWEHEIRRDIDGVVLRISRRLEESRIIS
jgi:DNA mismatch endonuclease (patch repair protein)